METCEPLEKLKEEKRMINEQDILSRLTQITYPGSRHNIVSLGLIRYVHIVNEGEVLLHLRPSSAQNEIIQQLAGEISALLKALPEVKQVEIHGDPTLTAATHAGPGAAPAQGAIPGVRKILAVPRRHAQTCSGGTPRLREAEAPLLHVEWLAHVPCGRGACDS